MGGGGDYGKSIIVVVVIVVVVMMMIVVNWLWLWSIDREDLHVEDDGNRGEFFMMALVMICQNTM